MSRWLKQSTAFTFRIGPFYDDTDFKTVETGLTIAQADIQISKNGGAFAQTSASPTTTHDTDGWYQCPLTATDTGTLGPLTVQIVVSGALPVWEHFMVVPANEYDSLISGSDALDVEVASMAAGTVTAAAVATGAIDADAIATDAITAAKIAASAITSSELADGAITAAKIATDAITAAKIAANAISSTELADGAITAAKFGAGAITSTVIATDAIGSDELAATGVGEIADAVWDEDIADHTTTGTFGEAGYVAAYGGPYGLGVYIDDGAANTATVAGEDGTVGKPVSTMAAARTIADAIGVKRYYFTGVATEMDIAATTEDWHFVGLCDVSSNILDLNSQDVDRSLFENITLQGVQGGTGRITVRDCVLRDDPGAGSTTLRVHASRCGLESSDPGILLSNNDDHIFENCYSMVAGNGTPMIDAQSGANVALNIRSYSGGIELKGLSGTSSTSVETDGQVVFNATNTTTAPVTLRGNLTITDNATMTALTTDAVINVDQINAEVDNALDTAIPGGATADSINERIAALDDLTEAAGAGDLAAILTDTGTTIPGTITTLQADTDDIQTRLPAALVSGRIDANIGAISDDATAADNLEAMMDGIIVAQVNDASATTTAFAADGFTEATDDHFNGRLITFISGALSGQQTDITDYDAAGGVQGSQEFTVTALTEAPANNDFFVVH